MGFWDAVRRCMAGAATFSGRSGRHEFWWFALFLAGVLTVMMALAALDPAIGQMLTGAAALLVLPLVSVTVRRLHDIGLPGYAVLLGLVPLLGQVAIVWLMTRRGEPRENRFGDDPRYDFAASAA